MSSISDLVKFSKKTYTNGFVSATDGNLSIKLSDEIIPTNYLKIIDQRLRARAGNPSYNNFRKINIMDKENTPNYISKIISDFNH